jgi:putative transposase
MARMARVVVPGIPHHVIQRGNRRQDVFFGDDDYRTYLRLLGAFSENRGLEIWAYCLMPNHVHLICVPRTADALRAAVAETHRRYSLRVNFREDWRGHLWQERFHSFAMDEAYLYEAVRYVELNPVRAGFVRGPGDWPWSSAAARLGGGSDALLAAATPLEGFGDWRAYLDGDIDEETFAKFRMNGRTGRPLGDDDFVAELERKTGRALSPRKRGPKPKSVPGDKN